MAQQHKLGKGNTKVRGKMVNGELSVTFHSTEVVKVERGTVTLNTGGWFTNTTKTRMNQASNQFGLGYSVWQAKGDWYVRTPQGKEIEFKGNSVTFPL